MYEKLQLKALIDSLEIITKGSALLPPLSMELIYKKLISRHKVTTKFIIRHSKNKYHLNIRTINLSTKINNPITLTMRGEIDLFKELLQHTQLIQYCKIEESPENFITIHCTNAATVGFLSKFSKDIAQAAKLSGWTTGVILKVNGEILNAIPIHKFFSDYNMEIIASTRELAPSYQELLEIACNSSPNYATYITVIPSRLGRSIWEWGKPVKCILTSDGVKNFSSRLPFNFHGKDVTLLYDKLEMERQMTILTRELERSPKQRIIIKDFQYETYLSDKDCEDIRKDPSQKYSYNADFEMMNVEGLGIIRICHCKERVRL